MNRKPIDNDPSLVDSETADQEPLIENVLIRNR